MLQNTAEYSRQCTTHIMKFPVVHTLHCILASFGTIEYFYLICIWTPVYDSDVGQTTLLTIWLSPEGRWWQGGGKTAGQAAHTTGR
jgi:hypothetical protein